jgi:phosphoglycerate kinase
MNYNKKSVKDIDVSRRRVLLQRCDFNVPADNKTGAIRTKRASALALPTIQ